MFFAEVAHDERINISSAANDSVYLFFRVTDLLRHPGKIDMRGERMRYHTDNFCCLDLHERVKHR